MIKKSSTTFGTSEGTFQPSRNYSRKYYLYIYAIAHVVNCKKVSSFNLNMEDIEETTKTKKLRWPRKLKQL